MIHDYYYYYLLLHFTFHVTREDRWGTTDDFSTSSLHLSLSPQPSGSWRTPALSTLWCCLPTSSYVLSPSFPVLHIPLGVGELQPCPLFGVVFPPLRMSSLHLSLFSTSLWELANSRPVHSLTMSFHLFLSPLSIFPCLHSLLGVEPVHSLTSSHLFLSTSSSPPSHNTL